MSLAEVREFHILFGHPIGEYPHIGSKELIDQRLKLMWEEYKETMRDFYLESGGIVKVADGLSDLQVVTNGTILALGVTTSFVDFKIPRIEGTPSLEREEDFLIKMSYIAQNLDSIEYYHRLGNRQGIIESLWAILKSVYATAEVLNIPLEEVNKAVHKANMSKLGSDGLPIYNDWGKIMKGPNFRAPEEDIERILKEHGAQL